MVGNCQARPLGQIIQLMLPEASVLEPILFHLIKAADEKPFLHRLNGADFILAQLVMDSFPVPFVRTTVLRERFGSRVIPWLNLYYRGQNPELFYYRDM